MTLENLVGAKRPRSQVLRRWIVDHWIPTVVINLVVAVWLFVACDLPATIALITPALTTVLFLAWPLLALLWRLRIELMIVAIVGAEWRFLPPFWFTTLLAAQVITFLVVPQLRRLGENQFWCVVTSHRLRGVLQRKIAGKKVGRCPILLWTWATPVGERTRIWMPSGLAASSLEAVLPEIAVACWAKQARLTPNRTRSHVVDIDVIRRDQLDTTVDADITAEFNGIINQSEFATADQHVTNFMKNISLDDIAVKEPMSESKNGSKTSAPRTKPAQPATEADDPF